MGRVLAPELPEALSLSNLDVKVVVGELDDPNMPIQAGTEMILIGSVAAENRFLDIYEND